MLRNSPAIECLLYPTILHFQMSNLIGAKHPVNKVINIKIKNTIIKFRFGIHYVLLFNCHVVAISHYEFIHVVSLSFFSVEFYLLFLARFFLIWNIRLCVYLRIFSMDERINFSNISFDPFVCGCYPLGKKK